MIVEPTPLEGLLILRPDRHEDERGFFARLWGDAEFQAAGLQFTPRQISVSYNAVVGTLRGLHWQAPPHGEVKLVSVMRGKVFDVAADLRPDSPTYRRWFGTELNDQAHAALLIPRGFAHGFVTLCDAAELLYLIDTPYVADAARGVRYDDPALAIDWPQPPRIVSQRDRDWPPLGEAETEAGA